MLSDDKSMNSDAITINLWNCENNSIDDNDTKDLYYEIIKNHFSKMKNKGKNLKYVWRN